MLQYPPARLAHQSRDRSWTEAGGSEVRTFRRPPRILPERPHNRRGTALPKPLEVVGGPETGERSRAASFCVGR